MIISRALYGLKRSSAAWRAKLAETLILLGYKSYGADADVWMEHHFNTNGDPYYKCMLCYVDDFLHIGLNPKEDMDALNMIYRLKEGIGPPERYLVANVEKVQLKYGRFVWSTNCVGYLNSKIENFDNSLGVDKMSLNNYGYGHMPYSSRFRTELDFTEELGEELTNRYQQLIGVLRFSIELGRIDILTEVGCLSQHLCSPREVHIDDVYRIFIYL